MRLLLADDDAMMLRLVNAALEPLGYEMLQAHDGREAWSHLVAEHSPPQIALMDWEMPGITGPELCRRARALNRPVPTYCLLLTGRGDTQDVVVGLEQGADDYVVKPFKPDELRARVRAAVRIVELQQHLADRLHALEGALAEVRQLQSLLPVCAWCKKIRDEENYWEMLETYVAKRLDIRFSHGVCPDCRQKFLQPRSSGCDENPGAVEVESVRAMTERGIAAVRQHLAALPPMEAMSVPELRLQYDRAERVFAVGPEVQIERLETPRAERLQPPTAQPRRMVLYLHGGGYVIGSPRSHRHLAAAIASAAAASALLLDYRLAPEHPFPAALDDAVAAYRWLLDHGVAPGGIVIAGDSAGGGLTVATLVALRDAGLPRPAAAVCISPWVDLTCSAPSYAAKAATDPIVVRQSVARMATAYLGAADRRTPLASPLFADLAGLPPLLIHVGSEEVLLDDSIGLADRATKAGVEATLDVWPEMVHVWHWFLPMLDEAQAAIDRIGIFARARFV